MITDVRPYFDTGPQFDTQIDHHLHYALNQLYICSGILAITLHTWRLFVLVEEIRRQNALKIISVNMLRRI